MGYRVANTTGVAKGNEPETLYMVTSGQYVNDGCCFEYVWAACSVGIAVWVDVLSRRCATAMEMPSPTRQTHLHMETGRWRPLISARASAYFDSIRELLLCYLHSRFHTRSSVSGYWCGGQGDVGPWVLADLENGLWGCGTPGAHNNNNTPLTSLFVTAMVKGGVSGFALKGGNATEGSLLTMYDGPRPPGYQPMKKQGAISEC